MMTVYLDKTSSVEESFFLCACDVCSHMSLCVQTLVYLPGGQRSVASAFLGYYLPSWTENSLIWLDWLEPGILQSPNAVGTKMLPFSGF